MNRILRTIASVALLASALSVSAQEKTIVFADWNIRSFEKSIGACSVISSSPIRKGMMDSMVM